MCLERLIMQRQQLGELSHMYFKANVTAISTYIVSDIHTCMYSPSVSREHRDAVIEQYMTTLYWTD